MKTLIYGMSPTHAQRTAARLTSPFQRARTCTNPPLSVLREYTIRKEENLYLHFLRSAWEGTEAGDTQYHSSETTIVLSYPQLLALRQPTFPLFTIFTHSTSVGMPMNKSISVGEPQPVNSGYWSSAMTLNYSNLHSAVKRRSIQLSLHAVH